MAPDGSLRDKALRRNSLQIVSNRTASLLDPARSVHKVRAIPKCFELDTRYIRQAVAPPDSGSLTPTESTMTTTAKKKRVISGLPKKTYWHLYSLQNLQAEKLAKIVNKVLTKDYVLIK